MVFPCGFLERVEAKYFRVFFSQGSNLRPKFIYEKQHALRTRRGEVEKLTCASKS